MPAPANTQEPASPWLDFFRRIKVLAAELDEIEAQEPQTKCRE
jgi:hypothetical protein